jgi:hypothetical protein
MTAWDMVNVSQMGLMIVVGLPKLRVLRQNLPVRSAPPRANKVREKETQRVANSWHFLRPHRGNPTSSSFVSESRQEVFFMPFIWASI